MKETFQWWIWGGEIYVKLQFGRFNGQTGPTKYTTWIVMTNLFDSCQKRNPTQGDEIYVATGHVDGLLHLVDLIQPLGVAYSGNSSSNKPSQQDGAKC